MSPSHPFLILLSHRAAWPGATLSVRTQTHKLQYVPELHRHHRYEPLFYSQKTSTDRMHVLPNIHLLTKNRKDIVSSGNVALPFLKSFKASLLHQTLTMRQRKLLSDYPFKNKAESDLGLSFKHFWVHCQFLVFYCCIMFSIYTFWIISN